MEFIFESLKEAFLLIIRLDKELLFISWTSIWIATTSTILSLVFGIPLAFAITTNKFKGKQILITIINTLMALPTVVVGLLVYSFICRRGFFGDFKLLYTPYAMIIGQFILVCPIITSLVISVLSGADERIQKTVLTLGATKFQSVLTLAGELRSGFLASIITGFGRVFSEVGVSMMLGGNIKNYTRNITTAIALETAKGEFTVGLALGMVLLIVAFKINLISRLLIKK